MAGTSTNTFMAPNNENTYHSMPNLSRASECDHKKKKCSVSLSEIKRNTDFSDYYQKPAAFHTRWINGYSPKVGVININRNGSTIAFYAASNCGVLYNWTTNQMRILQGHKHMVTCLASDSQGKWLVTADSGPENILIIWDSGDNFPQKTLFSPHGPTSISLVALSGDAKYLMTLGYTDVTEIYWWIWSFGLDIPHAELKVDIPKGGVIAMAFDPENSEQFAMITKQDLWFGISGKIFVVERGLLKETDDYELKIRKVEYKLASDCGKFTSFTFVTGSSQILVATSRGNIFVYRYNIEFKESVSTKNYKDLKFVKVVKMEKHRINVIKHVDGVVVTGNSAGEIHFYDAQMKLLYWVHGFTVDAVKGLSFNISPRSVQILDTQCGKPCLCWEKVVAEVDPETGAVRQKLLKSALPSDATITVHKPFIVRDFIVCTRKEGVSFVDFVTEKLTTLINCKTSPALALSVHPEKDFVAIGYENGHIDLFNFIQHQVFVRQNLREHYKIVTKPNNESVTSNYDVFIPKLSVCCLQYSPSGLHLACGLNTGELVFLHPTTIDITQKQFKDTSYAIKDISYSADSLTLAFYDVGRTVCVYKYDCDKLIWTFIGKHRAHYKDVKAIFFLPKNDDGNYNLISLGADRIMVEYDIAKSTNEQLEIESLDRIDQTAIPLAGILWPSPKDLDPEVHNTNLPTILVANDENKYKIINYKTTMTMATVLGPRYEHPVSRMELVSSKDGDEELQYLVFATKTNIGIQKLPLDGNPWKHVGLLGHPNLVVGMCYRQDIKTLFTIGEKDNCMIEWAANYRAVETTSSLSGRDLDPYYCIIENGRPGWLFQEIRDLFYYIQILCQGTFSPAMRRVKDYIAVDSLPDMMRALGFFPSEYEVENLVVEAKYKVYQKAPTAEIDFEEFVKLYLNHRPAFGYSFKKLHNAFQNFSIYQNENYVISREDFIDMLSNSGERFPTDLSSYLLSILCGQSFEDRAVAVDNDFSFLPEDISFNYLTTHIMGIQLMDNLSEQGSVINSLVSQNTSTESEDKLN